jgi:hypothetical protein
MSAGGDGTLQVELVALPWWLMLALGVLSAGVAPLAIWLAERRWPRVIDADGITTRAGVRVRWHEITRVEHVVTIVNRTRTERWDIHAPGVTVAVVVYRLRAGPHVLDAIMRRVPPHVRPAGW